MFNKADLLLACEVQTLHSFLIHPFLNNIYIHNLLMDIAEPFMFLGPDPVPIIINEKLSLKVKGPIFHLNILPNNIVNPNRHTKPFAISLIKATK